MPYTYTWTPESERPNEKSKVQIRTWDGRNLIGTSYSISDGRITFTVPEKNRYRVNVRTGSVSETTTLTIPTPTPLPPLHERVENLEEALNLNPNPGQPTANINLIPDPNNEGFFIIEQTN